MAVTSGERARLAVLEPVGPASADPGSIRRPPTWTEALVIVWLAWLYDQITNLSSLRLRPALAHGSSILHLERVLHIDPELALNVWAASHRAIARPMSDFYDMAHFVVTFAVIGWLWWRHAGIYRPLRNNLVLINVIGFLVFWRYPVAPPRMLPGTHFADVVALTHAVGSWHTGALASQANELAAMPSLHIAWACWSALALGRIFRHHRWRVAFVGYPIAVGFAVMATGNHYLLDVVAGVATMLVTTAAAEGWQSWRARRTRGSPPATLRDIRPGRKTAGSVSLGPAGGPLESVRDRSPATEKAVTWRTPRWCRRTGAGRDIGRRPMNGKARDGQ